MSTGTPEAQAPGKLARMLPGLARLREYEPRWLGPDLVAGLTLAAYLLPAGIADASLAQLPPESGLYACLFSGLVFWLFCSSRHTAITVTSAISLLVGATLGDLAPGDPTRRAAPAAGGAPLVAGRAPRRPPPGSRRARRASRGWSPRSRSRSGCSTAARSSTSSPRR